MAFNIMDVHGESSGNIDELKRSDLLKEVELSEADCS